jgi:hypothetical protein
MGTQSPGNQNRSDQPPTPGGDPNQETSDIDILTPRPGQDKGKNENEDKKGFGHIGNKDVPSSEGTPEPHEIF